nr:hypothetical protein B0A51_06638 [Rachicladosporium sp. CCFEE 5018]
MASSRVTRASLEIFLNVQLALLTIAMIMAILLVDIRWTERRPRLDTRRLRLWTLPQLALIHCVESTLVWVQVLTRGGLTPNELAWQSTFRALEGCGITLGGTLLGQMLAYVMDRMVERRKRWRRSVRDVEERSGVVGMVSVEERGTGVIDMGKCMDCNRLIERVAS